ncbi:helix-turn-helix domain-containing protein [Enterococcus sp. 5H]|uniref:helix-turn-helix domain-containing protein n=1 Tax=Enterococcus sp. 5H TaxID=1229490 RepID=UPI002304B319|nr:helix-turn-helix domain-containing protein [Enterococcus sp. 5H]MDA9472856.1 transcriptional regulator, AraC family [Enterococcus sp. 5H]
MTAKSFNQLLTSIENNLTIDLTADELAKKSGYSTYYFYRLFSSNMGISLSAYILNRRLKKIVYEISCGKKAMDVSLHYGFSTYAGFYKAFIKEYGCSPKKYLEIYKNEIVQTNYLEVKMIHLNKCELKEILKNWAISPSLSIQEISTDNSLYAPKRVWQIGTDYFLHQTVDTSGELKNILIAETLAKHGLSVSLPVKTIDDQLFIEDDAMFILKQGVKGEPLTIEKLFRSSADNYGFSYGIAIAKLHQAFLEVEDQVLCDSSNLFEVVNNWALPIIQKQQKQWKLEIPEKFFSTFIENFSTLYGTLPTQIIHRDPNFENILFVDSSLNGFIDFDLVEKNIRLFDPCYCATSILSQANKENRLAWISILTEILHGYDEENPLTKEEKRAIFYVICAIQMICVAYFSDEDNDTPTFKKLAKINRELLEFIISKQKEIELIFD